MIIKRKLLKAMNSKNLVLEQLEDIVKNTAIDFSRWKDYQNTVTGGHATRFRTESEMFEIYKKTKKL